MQAMVYRGGIDPTRITAKGYGPEQPVAPNTTKAGRTAEPPHRAARSVILRSFKRAATMAALFSFPYPGFDAVDKTSVLL